MATTRAKKQPRRFTSDTAPPALRDSGVDEEFWPSRWQHDVFWRFLDQPLRMLDGEAGWLSSRCPVCDVDDESATATAALNFRYGSYKCMRSDPCHAGRGAATFHSIRYKMNVARQEASAVDWDAIEPDPADVAAAEEIRARAEKFAAGRKR